jgi:hypothetical protein
MPVIPAVGRWRQMYHELEANLGYIMKQNQYKI